jgi:hypothetical protein
MLRITFLALLVGLTACGGTESKPKTPAEAPPPVPAPVAAPRDKAALGPMCDRYYVRQRACVSEYLSALLDVRVEYNMPPGIADHVKQVGKPAALAEARVDWERDTTLEVTGMICKAMAERTPDAHVERLLKDGEACEATKDCTAFATCAVDTERTYIKSGAKH